MKILHMSDLHLGAKTESCLRLSEQREVLLEIVSICSEQKIDVVLIAGDIFHTSTPSAEAEDLFYSFLEQLTKNDDRAVLVVAGNHDDPKRLTACLPLAKRHNIVIASDLSKLPKYEKHGLVQIIDTDRGFVKLRKNDEIVCVAMLAYPAESRMIASLNQNEKLLENYEDNVIQWANIACEKYEKESFNVLLSHLYLVGAHEYDESIDKKQYREVKIGDALAINPEKLPKSDYIAVGHLHTMHKVLCKNSTVYYSGATTKLRYYDAPPKVIVLDTEKLNPTEVLLEKAKNIVIVEVDYNNLFDDLQKLNSSDLIYLKILNCSSLPSNIIKQIREEHANVLSIKFSNMVEKDNKIISVKHLMPKELFVEFYKQKRNKEPNKELIELFLNLLEDNNETENINI